MGTLKSRRYRYRRFTRAPASVAPCDSKATESDSGGRSLTTRFRDVNTRPPVLSSCMRSTASAAPDSITPSINRYSRRLAFTVWRNWTPRKERLGEKRIELERLKAKVVAIPTLEMLRQIGDELRKRVEEGPRPAGMLLRRVIRRIIVSPTGSLKAELVIGTHENIKGSADEFDTSDRWWRWGESNPRPRTCQ